MRTLEKVGNEWQTKTIRSFFISVFCYCQLVAREPFHYLKFFVVVVVVIGGVVVIAFFISPHSKECIFGFHWRYQPVRGFVCVANSARVDDSMWNGIHN